MTVAGIMAAAYAYGAGRPPQHDDMTLVALRVSSLPLTVTTRKENHTVAKVVPATGVLPARV